MTLDDVESLKNQARAQIEALRASLKPLTGGAAPVPATDANAAR
jgi:hypothetical protein